MIGSGSLQNLPQTSLNAYISKVHSYEFLSKETEEELSERLSKHNDIKAAQRLVFAHLRYVVK